MLDVVAPFEAKRHTAYGVAPEKAQNNASAPLIARAFVFDLRAQFFVTAFAVRALESHGFAFPIQTRQPHEFALLLCQQEF